MFDGIDRTACGLLIAPTELACWVRRVHPHLVRMADGSGGRYDIQDILADLATGNMQLWVALDSQEIACVMLTQIMVYPRFKVLRCIGVVGSRPRRWMHLLADVERIAKERFGCARIEAMHTPGHERLLRTGGWRVFHFLSEKIL